MTRAEKQEEAEKTDSARREYEEGRKKKDWGSLLLSPARGVEQSRRRNVEGKGGQGRVVQSLRVTAYAWSTVGVG